jgi:hypothetical protein
MISASAMVSLGCERLREFRGSQRRDCVNIKKGIGCCQYTLNILFIEEAPKRYCAAAKFAPRHGEIVLATATSISILTFDG